MGGMGGLAGGWAGGWTHVWRTWHCLVKFTRDVQHARPHAHTCASEQPHTLLLLLLLLLLLRCCRRASRRRLLLLLLLGGGGRGLLGCQPPSRHLTARTLLAAHCWHRARPGRRGAPAALPLRRLRPPALLPRGPCCRWRQQQPAGRRRGSDGGGAACGLQLLVHLLQLGLSIPRLFIGWLGGALAGLLPGIHQLPAGSAGTVVVWVARRGAAQEGGSCPWQACCRPARRAAGTCPGSSSSSSHGPGEAHAPHTPRRIHRQGKTEPPWPLEPHRGPCTTPKHPAQPPACLHPPHTHPTPTHTATPHASPTPLTRPPPPQPPPNAGAPPAGLPPGRRPPTPARR